MHARHMNECDQARRAVEAAARAGSPHLVAFVHVPNVRATKVSGQVARRLHPRRSRSRPPITFDDLVRAGEAIMRAVLAAHH